jgi:hypothetical protein
MGNGEGGMRNGVCGLEEKRNRERFIVKWINLNG